MAHAPPKPDPDPYAMSWDEATAAEAAAPTEAPAPPPTASPALADAKQFRAELDVAEVDDRFMPGPAWTARAELLSRSHLVFRSRSLVYSGRRLILAVHLIDGEPVGLLGRVQSCDYEGEGQHKVVIALETLPRDRRVLDWLQSRVTRRR